jgi:hypothetical protein
MRDTCDGLYPVALAISFWVREGPLNISSKSRRVDVGVSDNDVLALA